MIESIACWMLPEANAHCGAQNLRADTVAKWDVELDEMENWSFLLFLVLCLPRGALSSQTQFHFSLNEQWSWVFSFSIWFCIHSIVFFNDQSGAVKFGTCMWQFMLVSNWNWIECLEVSWFQMLFASSKKPHINLWTGHSVLSFQSLMCIGFESFAGWELWISPDLG